MALRRGSPTHIAYNGVFFRIDFFSRELQSNEMRLPMHIDESPTLEGLLNVIERCNF